MGFFSAEDFDVHKAAVEFQRLLVGDEEVLAAFRTVRDKVLLTDFRILYVDVQGLTGSKIEYQSIPWRSVIRFSVETAGTIDLDADLKIWVSGSAAPVETKISRKSDPHRVQQIIAQHVLRKG